MSGSPIVNALSHVFTSGGTNRVVANQSGLEVNGYLVDISYTVPGGDGAGGWEFLRSFILNVNLRLQESGLSQVALVSNVPVYDLLAYSDYIAGVSMWSTTFAPGKRVRISGYLPFGYFNMGSRDNLETVLTIDPAQLPADVSCTMSACYSHSQGTLLQVYKHLPPTGADQSNNNTLGVYYIGTDSVLDKSATIRDQLGVNSVNVEDAIAETNARGRFEFFTRFGRLWYDPYGLSQNVTMQVPAIEGDNKPSLLLVGYEFAPELFAAGLVKSRAEAESLKAKIAEGDPVKYKYLSMIGSV